MFGLFLIFVLTSNFASLICTTLSFADVELLQVGKRIDSERERELEKELLLLLLLDLDRLTRVPYFCASLLPGCGSTLSASANWKLQPVPSLAT